MIKNTIFLLFCCAFFWSGKIYAQVSHELYFGAASDGNAKFNGKIASIRLFDKELSDNEIKILSAQPIGQSNAMFAPNAEWLFNNIHDSVFNASTGDAKGIIRGNVTLSEEENIKSASFKNGFVKAVFDSSILLKKSFTIEASVKILTPNSKMFILYGNDEQKNHIELKVENELLIFSCGKEKFSEQFDYHQDKWIRITVTKDDDNVGIFINGKRGDLYRNTKKIQIETSAAAPDNALALWYSTPATSWNSSLVIGNGNLGGMVMGAINNENIYINNDELWSGEPRQDQSLAPNFLKSLPVIRQLIIDDKNEEAQKLADSTMLTRYNESYMPMGMLHIQYPFEDKIYDYQRSLDLSKALVKIKFKHNNISYEREVFASHPDKAIVVRMTADKKGQINFSASLRSLLHHQIIAQKGNLCLNGRAPKHVDPSYTGTGLIEYEDGENGKGIRFQMRLKAFADGGSIEIKNDEIIAKNCNSVTLALVTATSFNGFDKSPSSNGLNADSLNSISLAGLQNKTYAQLLSRHIEDYQSLFNRASLAINDISNQKNIETEQRIRLYQPGKDNGLAALYWQFGRYLLIAGSRKGTQPLNLQGIWNKDIAPAWSANYTLNCNAQINYWAVETTNLAECHLPLIKMTEELSVDGNRTAKLLYGTDGWVAHHNTDLWRTATPVSGSVQWAIFQVGGAWLTQHLWEHYAFSMDKSYLQQIWPYLKGAAVFFTKNMIREPSHNWLVTAPDTNFENYYEKPDGTVASVCIGPTSSMEMVRQLFINCIAASKVLGQDDAFRKELETMLPDLAPFQISPTTGELQEWLADWKHQSPGANELLSSWGAICSNQITLRANPVVAAALRKSFDDRNVKKGTVGSWMGAFPANMYVRLGDGNSGLEIFDRHIQTAVNPNFTSNFFGVDWQIDGNLGQTSAITEMLLQSQNNEIDLLPALPDAWHSGSTRGLRARGGFEVNMDWQNNELQKATIKSTAGGKCVIRPHQKIKLYKNGRLLKINIDEETISLDTKKDDVLTIER